jgi:hypothetical protein
MKSRRESNKEINVPRTPKNLNKALHFDCNCDIFTIKN